MTDANELTDLSRVRFHTDKIYLCGASWAGEVTAVTAMKELCMKPNTFYAKEMRFEVWLKNQRDEDWGAILRFSDERLVIKTFTD